MPSTSRTDTGSGKAKRTKPGNNHTPDKRTP